MAAKLHFAEDTLTLHLLLERLEGLIDVIIANENLHACSFVGIEFRSKAAQTGPFESGGFSRLFRVSLSERAKNLENTQSAAISGSLNGPGALE